MEDYDIAVESALEREEDPDEYLRRKTGVQDEFQALLQKCYEAIQKGIVAIVLLLLLVFAGRADSLTETQIAGQLEQGVIPLAVGVGDELALNLLNAQLLNISYTANEPTSLQLSIDSVLKAISIYVWPGGPTLITDQQSEPIVFAQSEMAIDTNTGVSLSPTSIDFGPTPVVTPEPSTILLCLAGLVWSLAFSVKKQPMRDYPSCHPYRKSA